MLSLNSLFSHICVEIPSRVSSLWQHRQSLSPLILTGFPQAIFLTVGRCASSIKLLKTSNLYFEEMPLTSPFFHCLLLFAFSFFFISVQHFYEK